ncbi:MAG: GC-type dockerin domain-anchored protein, partial [bacterium]
GDTVRNIRLSAVGTGRTANPTDNSNVNPLSRARFQIVAPNGVTVSSIVQPWATATQSSSTAEATASMNETLTSSAGTWTLRAWDTGNFAGIDSTLQNVTLSLLATPTLPSPVVPTPALVDYTFVSASDTINFPGEVKWFSVVNPVVLLGNSGQALHIDTEGSITAPTANDTAAAIFNANGWLVASDTLDGTDSLASFSFGSGSIPAPGNGLPYDGRDGALPPGTYYVAVVGGDLAINPNSPFGVVGTSAEITGTVKLNARFVPNTFATPPADATQIILTEGVWSTTSKALPAGGTAWFFFDLPVMSNTTGVLDIDTEGSTLVPVNDTAIALYRYSTGQLINQDNNDGTGLLSAISRGPAGTANWTIGWHGDSGVRFDGRDGNTRDLSNPRSRPSRTYVAVVGGDATTVDPATATFQPNYITVPPVANAGTVNLRVRYFTTGAPTNQTPPATPINLVDGGQWATATQPVGISDVKWFTFTTPSFDLSLTDALDIDVVGTNLQPDNDTSIGLYTAAGKLVDSNDDDGPGLLSQLSYGTGRRSSTGDAARFAGQDGTTSGTAGNIGPNTTYFLAVGTGTSTTHGKNNNLFSTQPVAGSLNGGSVTARVRAWSSGAPSDPAVPPANENLGIIGTTTPGVEAVVARTYTVTDASEVSWFSFTINNEVNDTNTFYLDIDTEGSAPGVVPELSNIADTRIGLYASTGVFLEGDDEDGSDSRSALSFGSTFPVRPPVPTGTSVVDADRNGRDGPLLAGTYYLCVATSFTLFGDLDFDVSPIGQSTINGIRVVNLRTNLPGRACPNPSNVSGPGQNTLAIDDELTADDIIVFLNRFFANDLASNVSGPGQNTSQLDNELTADDIIVFLNRFFAGC